MSLQIGVIYKLDLQEKGGRWPKKSNFVNVYAVKNVNRGGHCVLNCE